MQHQSFLGYKRYRYLKWAAWLTLMALGAYGWHRNTEFSTPGGLGYGGTWMGYTLGSLAGLLILWLLWLGIRKRRYRASSSTLQGWLSAHVYLGLAAVVLASILRVRFVESFGMPFSKAGSICAHAEDKNNKRTTKENNFVISLLMKFLIGWVQ